MATRIFIGFLILIGGVASDRLSAQFFNVGLGVSAGSHSFSRTMEYQFLGNPTSSVMDHQLNLVWGNIFAMYRPKRSMGFGVLLSYPISQQSASTLIFPLSMTGRWEPKNSKYELKTGLLSSVFFRYFIESKLNFYAEASIGYSTITENFEFSRDSAPAVYNPPNVLQNTPLEALNINETNTYPLIQPSIQLGLMPHVNERVFLDLGVRLNYINQPKSELKYVIEASWNYTNAIPTVTHIQSPLTGESYLFPSGHFTIGVFF